MNNILRESELTSLLEQIEGFKFNINDFQYPEDLSIGMDRRFIKDKENYSIVYKENKLYRFDFWFEGKVVHYSYFPPIKIGMFDKAESSVSRVSVNTMLNDWLKQVRIEVDSSKKRKNLELRAEAQKLEEVNKLPEGQTSIEIKSGHIIEDQNSKRRRVLEVFGSTYQLLLNEIEKAGYKHSDFQLPQMELIDLTKDFMYYKNRIFSDSEFGFRFKPDDSDIVFINICKNGINEIKDLEISRINLPEHFRDWIKKIKAPVKKNSPIKPKSEPTEKPFKRKILETIFLGIIKWAVVAFLSYIATQGLKPLYAAIVIALLIILGLISKKISLLIDHYFPN